MNSLNQLEPGISDYYADLGLPQDASFQDIKLAFFKLAKQHHPDRRGPGKCIDTQEFCKARDAYDCLKDQQRRAEYDAIYFKIRDQWTRYRQWQEAQRKAEEQRRVEEQLRAARGKAERERVALEAEKTRELEEGRRLTRERARLAEERSQEAARRARDQQAQAAKERLRREEREEEARRTQRREKELEAEKRSEEAVRKIRIEQERAAQERLKAMLIEEKQDAIRRDWAKLRQAAEHHEATSEHRVASNSKCGHPPFGWSKKKGRARCVFCGEIRKTWSFKCPECSVSACPGCKDKYYMNWF